MTWYDELTNTVRTGIAIVFYPFNDGWGTEVQKAPDDGGGDPDVGNAETIAFVNPGIATYVDLQPLDVANRFYRTRHIDGTATPSAWTSWTDAAIPDIIPDPLPPIPTLPAPTVGNVQADGFDDGADIDWTVRWETSASVNSADHDLTIQYFVDDDMVEEETGVSVDEAQPYLNTTVGAGGLGGGEEGWALFILELKSTNRPLDELASRRIAISS